MQFNVGDVVRIQTGGPEMVVEFEQTGDEVRLTWTYCDVQNLGRVDEFGAATFSGIPLAVRV